MAQAVQRGHDAGGVLRAEPCGVREVEGRGGKMESMSILFVPAAGLPPASGQRTLTTKYAKEDVTKHRRPYNRGIN